MNEEYKCHHCGGVFEKEDDWSDGDAEKELHNNFGKHWTPDACVTVCDDCYHVLMGTQPEAKP